jgi:hypothetical protein
VPTLLIIVGAVFEALGFAAVALDLRDVERESKQLSQQHRGVLGRAALAGAGALTAEGKVIRTGEPSAGPTLEERVGRVERELQETSDRLTRFERREKGYHREILERAGGWVDEARMEAWERGQELQRVIGRAVGGRIWLKKLGLALFLIGLGVQTSANVVSL